MEKTNQSSHKFSIILPVKNGGDLIKQCINSILTQSNPNFNLLILENCSTDGTSEWLKTISDHRVVTYPSDRPLSIEENWSRIKSVPKNEFITIIGHDDILYEHFIEEMNTLIDRFPDASLYLSHYDYIDQNGKIFSTSKPFKSRYLPGEFTEAILKFKIEPIGGVMRSSDYDKEGGIPPYPNLLYADYALWINLASISYTVVHSARLFSYRIHRSTSKTTPASMYIDALFNFLSFLQAKSINNDEMKLTIEASVHGFIRLYCQSLSLRLLKTPFPKRQNKTINSFVLACKEWSAKFSGSLSLSGLTKLAILVDKTIILKNLYPKLRNISLK